MTSISLDAAAEQFQVILERLNTSDVRPFLNWIKERVNEELGSLSQCNSDIILESIRSDLRTSLPLEAIAQTETICHPIAGPNADCDPRTTIHVDAFLYNDDETDDLCNEGKLSRNYCVDCMSRNTQPLTFITHSASVSKLKYIYKYLLPELRGKTVLDVGSRTGALLYAAYLYTEAEKIVGVEIDKSFCELQQQVISKYNMANRIQIVHDDICRQEQLLKSADVIIMNNVFEFFTDLEQQKIIWSFLRQTVRRPGTILVTSPSIQESLAGLQVDFNVSDWLQETGISVQQTTAVADLFSNPDDSDINDVFMYQVTLTGC